MKKLALLITVILLPFMITMAQDKASAVKRLMAAMQMEKTIDSTMGGIRTAMAQQMKDGVPSDSLNNLMDFVASETTAITKQMIAEDLPAVYEKNFDLKEIKDLTAFYESPTGKKLVEKTPEVSKEIMTIMSTKYMPILNKKIQEKVAETIPSEK